MKNLKQVKNEVSVELGYKDYDNFLCELNGGMLNYDLVQNVEYFVDEVVRIYSEQFISKIKCNDR